MSSTRRRMAGAAIVVALAALFAPAAVASASGATALFTGSLVSTASVRTGPGAVAVVVLVDQSKGSVAGTVVGLQRIDAPGSVPIAFEIPYDGSSIAPTGSYAVFASVQDGTSVWQNLVGVPVITGGPSSDVQVALTPVPAAAATVSGQLAMSSRSALSASAVAIAALVKVDTGTVVGSARGT